MIMGPFFEFPILRCEDRHGLALLLESPLPWDAHGT